MCPGSPIQRCSDDDGGDDGDDGDDGDEGDEGEHLVSHDITCIRYCKHCIKHSNSRTNLLGYRSGVYKHI